MNQLTSRHIFFIFRHKQSSHWLIFFFLFSLFFSCKKENRWDCLKRTGSITTEARSIDGFKSIYVEDNVNVILTQDSVFQVVVEAGENLLPLIETEVDTGYLFLRNKNKCNWARSYKNGTVNVHVSLPELKVIITDGTGLVSNTDTIFCNVLDVWTKSTGDVDLTIYANQVFHHLHSTADVTLRGYSSTNGIYHTGQGYLDCSGLFSYITWTQNKSAGNEYLFASDKLYVTIDWTGDVYYSGNPSVVELIQNGKGKLIKQN